MAGAILSFALNIPSNFELNHIFNGMLTTSFSTVKQGM